MKMLGVTIVSICVMYSGIGYSISANKRVRQLETLISMLQYFSEMLSNYPDLLCHLMKRISENSCYSEIDIFSKTAYYMENNLTFSQAWEKSLSTSSMMLTKEDIRPLYMLSQVLGQLDIESQKSAIKNVSTILCETLRTARLQVTKQTPMYRTLGICGGLAVFLFMM